MAGHGAGRPWHLRQADGGGESADGAYYRDDKAAILSEAERVYELFPRLKERQKQLAGTLSGGEQQMVAMGRAMLSKPAVVAG